MAARRQILTYPHRQWMLPSCGPCLAPTLPRGEEEELQTAGVSDQSGVSRHRSGTSVMSSVSSHALQFLVLTVWGGLVKSSPPPCSEYGCEPHHHQPHHHQPQQLYVPALPGKTPPCAKKGRTYCEKIEHYPTELIHHLIERWEYDYNTLFVNEKVPRDFIRPRPVYGPPAVHHGYQPAFFQTPPPPLHQHHSFNSISFNQSVVGGGYPERQYSLGHPGLQFNSNPDLVYSALLRPNDTWWMRHARNLRKKRQIGSTSLCPTTSQFIMPKAAMNAQGNWMYVVNLDTDQRYTQLIRSETCISRQCNGLCSLPNGYSSVCEQQFVQQRLVALQGSGQTLYTDLFWMPHCCICQITQTGR